MRSKQLLLFFLFITLLFAPIILSDDDITITPTSTPEDSSISSPSEDESDTPPTDSSTESDDSSSSSVPDFSSDPKDGAKKVGDAARAAVEAGLKSEKEEVTQTTITINEGAEKLIRFIFHLPLDYLLTLEGLVILISIFIIFLMYFYNALSSFTTFSKPASFVIALMIVTIMSVLGTANIFMTYVMRYGFYTILGIFGFMILLIILEKLAFFYIKQRTKSKNQEKGSKIRTLINLSEGIEEIDNEEK